MCICYTDDVWVFYFSFWFFADIVCGCGCGYGCECECECFNKILCFYFFLVNYVTMQFGRCAFWTIFEKEIFLFCFLCYRVWFIHRFVDSYLKIYFAYFLFCFCVFFMQNFALFFVVFCCVYVLCVWMRTYFFKQFVN